jgi:hypothetical protein
MLLPREVLGPVAMGEPCARRLPCGRRERDHAFLAALAAHQQHARIAPHRSDGKRDKLAHPQPRGVEQFHEAGVAQPFPFVPPALPRGVQKAPGLLHAQDIGERARLRRAPDLQAGIVGAPAFLMGEPVELLQRREPPRAGGGRHVGGLQLRQVALDRRAVGPGEPAATSGEVGHGVLEVPAIGQERVARGTPFGGLRLQEGGDPVAVGSRRHGSVPFQQKLQRRAAGDILEPHPAQKDQRVADIAGIALPVAEDKGRAQERLAHPVVVEEPLVAHGA